MNVYDISSRKKFVYIEQSAVAASLPPPPFTTQSAVIPTHKLTLKIIFSEFSEIRLQLLKIQE